MDLSSLGSKTKNWQMNFHEIKKLLLSTLKEKIKWTDRGTDVNYNYMSDRTNI